MKRLLFFILLVIAIVVALPGLANAQSTGRWITYLDPATGQIGQCYLPYDGALCQAYPPPILQYARQIYVEQPVYNTQRRRYKRHDWDGGFNGYRPWVRYSRTTETEIWIVETNAPNYQPQIYYRPYYPNW